VALRSAEPQAVKRESKKKRSPHVGFKKDIGLGSQEADIGIPASAYLGKALQAARRFAFAGGR